MSLKATFLGTGTSQGIPIIACDCEVCKSNNSKDKRLRSSVFVQSGDSNIIIDTGPDFRYQVLRANIKRLDAILFTHQHRDHIAGLDDVRSFNFKQKKAMPVYGNSWVIEQLKREFHYVFENKYPGIPQLEIDIIENKKFHIGHLPIIPVQVFHHKLPVFGFRILDFTYITDANYIPEPELDKIYGSKVLVLNALQREKHLSHFNLDEALKMIEIIKPEKAYLTHISHSLGLHDQVSKELPSNVFLAFDGLSITLQ